jgi:NADPH2 dehydrogenase
MSSKLFTPLQVGNVTLSHRIVMAPLTRFRASDTHEPLPIVAEYYAQRASTPGTLLISEATYISSRASGYPNTPGLYTSEQIAAWRTVTDAVHAKGSYIFVQLWALGRAARKDNLEAKGERVTSSSNVPISPDLAVPEPLTEDEIWGFIADFAQAAKNAIAAGFDGVEIHGANGYLIDQFTQDTANKRTDAWGGSVEKRARFAIEVAKAVVAAIGRERTAIRLSPYSPFQAMKMDDPVPTFTYLAGELKKLQLAYLHVVQARIAGNAVIETDASIDFLVRLWGTTSPVFIAGAYTAETAKKEVDETYKGLDVAIVFGRYFISNPDLPFRILKGIPFTPYDRSTFYSAKDPKGYIDWPFSKDFIAVSA